MKSTYQFPVLKNSCQLSCHIGTEGSLANKSHDLVNIGSLVYTGMSISGVVHHVLPGYQSVRIRSAALVKKTPNFTAPSEVGRELGVKIYRFVFVRGKGSEPI